MTTAQFTTARRLAPVRHECAVASPPAGRLVMVMTLHRLSAGAGYQYLLKHTAAGDCDRAGVAPLTDYYNESGNPPGRWLGKGLLDVDLSAGALVTEATMANLFGAGRHPLTGQPLGMAYYVYAPPAERIAAQTAKLPPGLDPAEREAAVATITRVELARNHPTAVAGFDLTHLHTHVVIANKVQALDGRWRSVDSRALHHAVVALSEIYDDHLADHLSTAAPVTWSWRDLGPRRSPGFELDGVDDALMREFSTRTTQIDAAMTATLAEFHAAHGRAPNPVEITRLRQQVTRATRPYAQDVVVGETLLRIRQACPPHRRAVRPLARPRHPLHRSHPRRARRRRPHPIAEAPAHGCDGGTRRRRPPGRSGDR